LYAFSTKDAGSSSQPTSSKNSGMANLEDTLRRAFRLLDSGFSVLV